MSSPKSFFQVIFMTSEAYIKKLELEILGNFLENPRLPPMRWTESYEMYGERRHYVDDRADLSKYENYKLFKACCAICKHFTAKFKSSEAAIHAHYEHCSKDHDYIFSQNYSKTRFKVRDETLQAIITASTLFSLPMPGYELHTRCIRQYRGSEIICAVHEGNESE